VLGGVKSGDRDDHDIGPYLTELDFLFHKFVKDNVYITPLSANIDDQWSRIIEAVAEVTSEKLCRIWEAIHYTLDICRATRVSRLEL
jgi:hypothetical protein